MRDAPATTFSSVFCAASATAMPPTPRPASAGVGSTPKCRSVASTPTKMASRSTPLRATRTNDCAAAPLARGNRRMTLVSNSRLKRITSQTSAAMLRSVAVLDPNWRSISGSGRELSSHRVAPATSSSLIGSGRTCRANNVESLKSLRHSPATGGRSSRSKSTVTR